MLDQLNPHFRLLAKAPPASEVEIEMILSRYQNVPLQFLELIREATSIEIQHVNGIYLRFWGPMGSIEMDDAYGISERIIGAIPIGDDGGGRVVFYMGGKNEFGIYAVGFGDLDADDAIWIVSSLGELLQQAKGIEAF